MKKSSLNKQSKSEINHYIPIKPISANSCWQGRRFRTSEYKQWQKDMILTMPKEKTMGGLLEIELIFGVKSLLVGDLDNKIKPVLDACVARGWITDDRYIISIKATKVKSKAEGVGIIIKNLINKGEKCSKNICFCKELLTQSSQDKENGQIFK